MQHRDSGTAPLPLDAAVTPKLPIPTQRRPQLPWIPLDQDGPSPALNGLRSCTRTSEPQPQPGKNIWNSLEWIPTLPPTQASRWHQEDERQLRGNEPSRAGQGTSLGPPRLPDPSPEPSQPQFQGSCSSCSSCNVPGGLHLFGAPRYQ